MKELYIFDIRYENLSEETKEIRVAADDIYEALNNVSKLEDFGRVTLIREAGEVTIFEFEFK